MVCIFKSLRLLAKYPKVSLEFHWRIQGAQFSVKNLAK